MALRASPKQLDALRRAIAAAGGQAALAEAVGRESGMGYSQQSVSLCLTTGTLVPPHIALAIEKLYGIDRCQLRPDVYPPRDYRRIGKAS